MFVSMTDVMGRYIRPPDESGGYRTTDGITCFSRYPLCIGRFFNVLVSPFFVRRYREEEASQYKNHLKSDSKIRKDDTPDKPRYKLCGREW